MKQTAVEFLVFKLKKQGLLIGEIDNLIVIEQAKELEKKQQDDFAIEFTEWLCDYEITKEQIKTRLEIFKNK